MNLERPADDVRQPWPPPTPSPASASTLLRLTRRQWEIVSRVAGGMPDKAIADELAIAEDTVGWPLQRLFEMCGVHCRAALVERCLHLGLLGQ